MNKMSEVVDVEFVRKVSEMALKEMQKVVVGKEDILKHILTALLANGHVLLEGFPGVAKTYMAKTFASVLQLEFKRVQFTPDLLPADIIGTTIFDQKTQKFEFIRGQVFTNILLADEINRAPPKTQSALLESMQERQVTVEGKTYRLDRPFMVLATQNPVETEGTYPLPEAQLDRFIFKLDVGYPDQDEEVEIIRRKIGLMDPDEIHVESIVSKETVIKMQEVVLSVYVDEDVLNYIASIVYSFRKNSYVLFGASPRSSISLLYASRALAAIEGRDYVEPDDVRRLVKPVLSHRLVLKPEAQLEGLTVEEIIEETLKELPVEATLPKESVGEDLEELE